MAAFGDEWPCTRRDEWPCTRGGRCTGHRRLRGAHAHRGSLTHGNCWAGTAMAGRGRPLGIPFPTGWRSDVPQLGDRKCHFGPAAENWETHIIAAVHPWPVWSREGACTHGVWAPWRDSGDHGRWLSPQYGLVEPCPCPAPSVPGRHPGLVAGQGAPCPWAEDGNATHCIYGKTQITAHADG